jgi:hypothetical protein
VVVGEDLTATCIVPRMNQFVEQTHMRRTFACAGQLAPGIVFDVDLRARSIAEPGLEGQDEVVVVTGVLKGY